MNIFERLADALSRFTDEDIVDAFAAMYQDEN